MAYILMVALRVEMLRINSSSACPIFGVDDFYDQGMCTSNHNCGCAVGAGSAGVGLWGGGASA